MIVDGSLLNWQTHFTLKVKCHCQQWLWTEGFWVYNLYSSRYSIWVWECLPRTQYQSVRVPFQNTVSDCESAFPEHSITLWECPSLGHSVTLWECLPRTQYAMKRAFAEHSITLWECPSSANIITLWECLLRPQYHTVRMSSSEHYITLWECL